MSPAKKKKAGAVKRRKKNPRPKKPQMVVITEQPVEIIQQTVPRSPANQKVWDAVKSIRTSLWYGFWIGVGLAPIGSHIISQFYCGTGETARCNPIEFPAWLELVGIIVALTFANAAKDVVSKSLKQLFDAAKDLPSLIRVGGGNGRRDTRENKISHGEGA
jgi:hypothetical protein